MEKKTGVLSAAQKEIYSSIEKNKGILKTKYSEWVKTLGGVAEDLKKLCNEMGLTLNIETGHLSYSSSFRPLNLSYDICYIRHGRTEGNTEPRIFQGFVDYPENELNDVGVKQAEEAALKMDNEVREKKWKPDLIVYSPLKRAQQTGQPFQKLFSDIPSKIVDKTAEMAFGEHDNRKVIEISKDDLIHLFWLDQNVVVKSEQPHKTVVSGIEVGKIDSECFVEVVERLKKALEDIQQLSEIKEITSTRRPKVLFYGHSMAGAAVSILMGHGKLVEDTGSHYLGMDGKYIMPNATPTFLPPKEIPH